MKCDSFLSETCRGHITVQGDDRKSWREGRAAICSFRKSFGPELLGLFIVKLAITNNVRDYQFMVIA